MIHKVDYEELDWTLVFPELAESHDLENLTPRPGIRKQLELLQKQNEILIREVELLKLSRQ